MAAEEMMSVTRNVPVSVAPILVLLARLMPVVQPPVRSTVLHHPEVLTSSIESSLDSIH